MIDFNGGLLVETVKEYGKFYTFSLIIMQKYY